jgi:uncharacterized protein YndB with AHSA1/START domain
MPIRLARASGSDPRRILGPCLAALVAAPVIAGATVPDDDRHGTMKSDLARRSPDIHWPEGFAPSGADLFAHNALDIDASCAIVWRVLVDAPKWPQWYANARDVKLADDAQPLLKPGAVFRWTTFGLSIESRVDEFVPESRLGWYGQAPGSAPAFHHTWLLVPREGGCRVVTEEVGIGRDAAALRRQDEGLMHRGHDLWLASLRWAAENVAAREGLR